MSHDKKHNDPVKPLKSELKLYRRQGVELYLDGSPSKPEDDSESLYDRRRRMLYAGLYRR